MAEYTESCKNRLATIKPQLQSNPFVWNAIIAGAKQQGLSIDQYLVLVKKVCGTDIYVTDGRDTGDKGGLKGDDDSGKGGIKGDTMDSLYRSDLIRGGVKKGSTTSDTGKAESSDAKSNIMKYVLWGAGILGGIALIYFVVKKVRK